MQGINDSRRDYKPPCLFDAGSRRCIPRLTICARKGAIFPGHVDCQDARCTVIKAANQTKRKHKIIRIMIHDADGATHHSMQQSRRDTNICTAPLFETDSSETQC